MRKSPVPEEELEPVEKHKDRHDHDHYDDRVVSYIQSVYIIASLLWVLLIFILDLWKNDLVVAGILLLPIIVYLINFVSLGEFTCSMEDQMFRGNFLSFGFLVAIILINWNTPLGHHDKTEFFKILIVAFILLMISLLDLWVDQCKMSVVKHIKTALHTASLSLLALALYLYYTYHRDQYSYDL
jgi:hypothetical protein